MVCSNYHHRLKEEVDAVVEMGNDRVKSFDREMEDRHSAQTREQQKWREEKSHEFQRIQKIHSLIPLRPPTSPPTLRL